LLPLRFAVPANVGIAALSQAASGISGRMFSLPASAELVIAGSTLPQERLVTLAVLPLSLKFDFVQMWTLPLPALSAYVPAQLTLITMCVAIV
jgi:hypothetical protein